MTSTGTVALISGRLVNVNKIDHDITGYDEISNGMKSMLAKVGLMKEVIEEKHSCVVHFWIDDVAQHCWYPRQRYRI